MIPPPPTSTLFPYTTLFRSVHESAPIVNDGLLFVTTPNNQVIAIDARSGNLLWRSEEHTSELQSPMYLVCRLLLEKKKRKKSRILNTKHNREHNVDEVTDRK